MSWHLNNFELERVINPIDYMRYKSERITWKSQMQKIAEKSENYAKMFEDIKRYKLLSRRRFFDD